MVVNFIHYNCVKHSILNTSWPVFKTIGLFVQMKSIFRLYAKTSKGNDSILLKELRQLNIKNPRYDQHLNSFYFNCNWTELFDVCFKCMTLEQMYLQIGQKFMVIDEQQLNSEL